MSEYLQNMHSFLTGRFKILHMIFVKNDTKEFCFFDYFYRRFSQKNVRVWGKNVLLVKVDAVCLGGGELEAVL